MNFRGLTVRVLATVFLLFLLIAAISSGWLYTVVREIVGDLGRNYAVERATASHNGIARILERESALAMKLADSPTIIHWMVNENDPDARARAFAELDSYRRAFADSNYFVALHDSLHYYNQPPDGDMVLTILDPEDPADEWYFATIAAGQDVSFNLDYNPSLDVSRVWINSVVRTDGETVGVTGTGLDITELISRLVSAEGRGTSSMLVDYQGVVIAHQDTDIMERNARSRSGEDKITVFDLIENGDDRTTLNELLKTVLRNTLLNPPDSERSAVEVVELTGVDRLIAMSVIPEIDAVMVATVDASSFVSLRDFAPMFLLVVLSLLIALAVLAVLMQRFVLRPLATMTDSAHRIAAGDYQLSIPEGRSDEIGTLASAFNRMAAQVYQYTTNLEGQVAERTQELTAANEQLETANRQVMESMRYARLIQDGVQPNTEELSAALGRYSLFHRQRDVVGGDYLFFRSVASRELGAGYLLGVVDCEGHGVSGALMTMMADSFLNQISAGRDGSDPAGMLLDLEDAVTQSLDRSGDSSTVRSGMDVGLCACFPEQATLVYAGAGMPLYFREADGTLTVQKGRRRAIKSRHRHTPEQPENVRLSSEDRVFFMVTDGFVDQDGETSTRVYGTRRLYELFKRVDHTCLGEGYPDWKKELDNYRGRKAQRDDVLAIAFTIDNKLG